MATSQEQDILPTISTPQQIRKSESITTYNLPYIFLSAFNDTLAFLFFTYNLSVFSALLGFLKTYIFPDTSSSIVTFIASAPTITAAIASLIAGPIAAKIGRRTIMLIFDVIGIIGVVLSLFASLPIMIAGRLLVGFSVGVTTVAVPLYFIEMTPMKYRGPISGGPTFFASLGSLLAFAAGFAVPKTLEPGETSQIWRIVLGISMIIPIMRIVSFLLVFKSETPIYLVEKNKIEGAQRILQTIYKTGSERRLQEVTQEANYVNSQGKFKARELVTKKYRKAFFVISIVMIMQMIAPLNIVVVFAKDIFSQGIDDPDASLPEILAVTLAAINVIVAIMFVILAGRFGRKPMLVTGTFFIGVCAILFGIFGLIISPQSMASKVFLLLWAIPFPLSLGPLPFALAPETLPPKGVSIATLFNWIFAFVTVQFYPNVSDALGVQWVFIILGSITLVGSLFFWITLVETKGKTQDDILKTYSGVAKEEEKDRQASDTQV